MPVHLQGHANPDDVQLSNTNNSRNRYDMTEEEKELMKHYGITLEQRSVYIYKGYKYAHLKDAVNYAKIEAERRDAESEVLD